MTCWIKHLISCTFSRYLSWMTLSKQQSFDHKLNRFNTSRTLNWFDKNKIELHPSFVPMHPILYPSIGVTFICLEKIALHEIPGIFMTFLQRAYFYEDSPCALQWAQIKARQAFVEPGLMMSRSAKWPHPAAGFLGHWSSHSHAADLGAALNNADRDWCRSSQLLCGGKLRWVALGENWISHP